MLICDSCQNKVGAVAFYGLMIHDKVEGRKSATICFNCSDRCPCNTFGSWSNGQIICKHGYVYNKDYFWENNIAKLTFHFYKRKWWSYFITTNIKHHILTNNKI